MPDQFKREIAYKLRIGDLLRGNQIFDETPSNPEQQTANKRLLHVELGNKKIVRVNILANIIEKYESEGERRFASLTLDDGSGQLRIRVFGEDIHKFDDLSQGDTIMVIGVLRSYNQELYVLPEIIKKQDPRYLLVRKLEIEKRQCEQQRAKYSEADNEVLANEDAIHQCINILPGLKQELRRVTELKTRENLLKERIEREAIYV